MTIKSHPVRYQGNLGIEGRSLVFRGNDLLEEIHCEEIIPFDSIIEVILPFDEHTQSNIDPWLNIGAPVTFIVRHQIDNGERTIYFTT